MLLESDRLYISLDVLLACSPHETAGAEIGYAPLAMGMAVSPGPSALPKIAVALLPSISSVWS